MEDCGHDAPRCHPVTRPGTGFEQLMMKMETIIEKVDRQLIENELTPERFLRTTNKAGNEIYVIDADSAPHTMREIGRLREIAFREAGGGTGKPLDIDEFDTMKPPCRQLIVWDPEGREIVGGYRFILGSDIVLENGQPRIATSHLFTFSDHFIRHLLPVTIELGRSFVSPDYQLASAGRKALYALDNLWDGLGALIIIYPEIEYLFGKVTMYPNFGTRSRDLVLGFLHKYFHDHDGLAIPKKPLPTAALSPEIQKVFTGGSYKEDYRILNTLIRQDGRNIPPLVNAYMNLSPTMRMFGTAINDEFGDVEESGILLKISDIFEEKKERHIGSFQFIRPIKSGDADKSENTRT